MVLIVFKYLWPQKKVTLSLCCWATLHELWLQSKSYFYIGGSTAWWEGKESAISEIPASPKYLSKLVFDAPIHFI